jgi:hypothetical protein
MAFRARLSVPPAPSRDDWPYHQASWSSVSTLFIREGDRRMEAETFLSRGYGVRVGIAAKEGWASLSRFADVTQPSRTKATLVNPEHGKPFLAATQIFDVRPIPRKWLAPSKVAHVQTLFVKRGAILVTRSGNVGRTTLSFAPHLNTLISDDLLRIEVRDPRMGGWIYAFLRAPKVRAMMTSAHYGHVIKHLETTHLGALPVPCVHNRWLTHFEYRVSEILDLRDAAYTATLAAEQHFAQRVGPIKITGRGEEGFVVKVNESLAKLRRRLEASAHNPSATHILQHFDRARLRIEPLRLVAERVWWMTRFKRVFGEQGVRYLSADELFQMNPEITKRVLIEQANDAEAYFVKRGWLVMACSGQTYGLLGSVRLMTKYEEDAFLSHDVIRITPRAGGTRPGYLLVALTHPELGRPLVLRCAYGTSIPHLDPGDIASCPIVRLDKRDEDRIADLSERAAELRSRADCLENEIAIEAEAILDRFLGGDTADVKTRP